MIQSCQNVVFHDMICYHFTSDRSFSSFLKPFCGLTVFYYFMNLQDQVFMSMKQPNSTKILHFCKKLPFFQKILKLPSISNLVILILDSSYCFWIFCTIFGFGTKYLNQYEKSVRLITNSCNPKTNAKVLLKLHVELPSTHTPSSGFT